MVRYRINNHISDIRNNKPVPVARHFNDIPHDLDKHFRFTPLAREINLKYRKYLESKFINDFGVTINERTDKLDRQSSIIPLVLPFSPSSAQFGYRVKQLAEKHEITQGKIITAFTKHKNFKSILSSSTLKQRD